MLYSYEAKDSEGRTVTGSLEAKDERTATTLVREQGYFLMRLTPSPTASANTPLAMRQPPSGNGQSSQRPAAYGNGYSHPTTPASAISSEPMAYGTQPGPAVAYPYYQQPPMTAGKWIYENIFRQIFTGVAVREMSLFYRQFATLINAGVPIIQSFDTLAAQSGNTTLRRVLRSMRGVVEAGGQISDGMALFPWLFKADHRGLVIAGETSGTLDRMFHRIASSLEMEHAFKQNMVKEITLPAITLCCAFLLPPLYLVIACGEAHLYYEQAVQPLLIAFAVLAGLSILGKMTVHVRYATDMAIANTPGVGGTVRLIALARFARTLASLYSAGVSVPQSVKYAADACGNAYMGQRTLLAIPLMESGYGIVDAMMQTKVFPPIVLSMLGIGETTGSIDVMMDKIADHFEQESIVRLHQTMTAVRTLATLFIGYKVLMILIQFYGGYFNAVLSGSDAGPCSEGGGSGGAAGHLTIPGLGGGGAVPPTDPGDP